jgi:tRNA G18 (ribose-2'-O)-methylase SpoU
VSDPDPAAHVVEISDPDDPRIAAFRQVRERDVAGRCGGFIAEGEVVLRVMARSQLCRPRSVLIAAKRVQRMIPLLDAFGDDVVIYAAAQGVMDAVVGFPIHRGLLAYGERPQNPSAGDLLASIDGRATIVCLFGVSNHDNVGGVFRNAAALGAVAVLLDAACCDPLYRKAIRVSVGATLTVPFARLEPSEDILALLARHGFSALALSPAGTMPLSRLQAPSRTAIRLGGEGRGVPEALLAGGTSVTIPMAAGFDSLNVATVSGIVLHHLVQEHP